MARLLKNAKIDTRSARARLPPRKPLYWITIASGCAVGYYKGLRGGSWTARITDANSKRHFESIGAADDHLDPDDISIFSYDQAQVKAREFFKRKTREFSGDLIPADGPYTVERAIEDYFTHRDRRSSKETSKDRSSARVHILPSLGSMEISKLTTRRIRDWHSALAEAPRLGRKGRYDEKHKPVATGSDPETIRARRATANRRLTVLKAALNHAYQEGRVVSDEAWRKVKPFRDVETAVVRYLNAEEIARLLNACAPDFRSLVRGALQTGCRYGELIRMKVADFNLANKSVSVRLSKSGKSRHVVLTNEGTNLFSKIVADRAGEKLIFLRKDEEKWGDSHQRRRLEDASDRAQIDPPVNFHILRHTYASALAMNGAPMAVIAAQLGHVGTRITEKHYAHLAPTYVGDTVRATLPSMGGLGE